MGKRGGPPPEDQRCTYIKKDGERCGAWQLKSSKSDKCHYHGGKAKKGAENKAFTHGQNSRYLPRDLAEKYQAGLQDKNLLELNEDIALVDTRTKELAEKLGTGESKKAWLNVRSGINMIGVHGERAAKALSGEGVSAADIKAARNSLAKLDQATENLQKLIKDGLDDYGLWDEIRQQVTLRKQLVDSQRMYLKESKNTITAVEMMTILGAAVHIISMRLNDPKISPELRGALVEGIANDIDGLLEPSKEVSVQ